MSIPQDLCIKILDKCPNIQQLKKLHSILIINNNLASASHIALKLIKAYSECRESNLAHQLFDKMPKKDVVCFNVMIRSYVNNALYDKALDIYRDMFRFSVRPDHFTVPQVLKACSGLGELCVGLQAHVGVVKKGLLTNVYVGNGLITMYGKCGRVVDGRKVFDEMGCKDVVSWNSLVAAYAQNGMFEDALDVCRSMMGCCDVKVNAGTMASLAPAVMGSTSSENVGLVKEMFVNYCRESLVSWNVMIAVYVNNGMAKDAVNLYLQMGIYGFDPDVISVASVLPAVGDLSALLLGRKIHEYVKRKRLLPNLTVENALIDMYAKCGSLKDARKVFDEMKTRDVVSWTSMVSAYGMSGDGQRAVTIFSHMQDSGLTPDSISFVPVLSACSHAGLLDEGKHFFRLMTDEYKIVPRLEHLACMVDLLGRSGRIDEAYEFIRNMKMEPNDRIWGALLSACKVHNNMDIGLVAADHLFQLVPEQAGYYVLLSNIYAKAGRWKDVTGIRSIMKVKGVKKEPGVSNVELNNQVHSFLAGDQSHPQSKRIYEELEVLVGKMRGLGYVPKTDSALHDIEDEDKGNHLAVHSEKLAIVFVIINTEPFTPIRITKNLRVCEDCHIAAKLISKIVEREIILRDTNRFHHFKNGVCTCGDYW
ncbi:tetratricopeptide repeat (TPR)-like superfamily protein [Artemisia annua]|uniref:Tetratricopeptide repeat (TPR)-like superfamily protein n=1 Tax=Artemisia annua TaxID=35608 RepID=A0A2U1NU88_ARTAN|nr:tetratricopeptide repeat (TPR)-like superfamily protein [Artemisia annua]